MGAIKGVTLGKTRRQKQADDRADNEAFYGQGIRTAKQHSLVLAHTTPEQRSGRVKLTCADCLTPIGPTTPCRPVPSADGSATLHVHLVCPS